MNGLPATLRRADRRAAEELADALDRGLDSGPGSALVARLVAARPALETAAQLSEQTRQAQRARLLAVATVRPPTVAPGTSVPTPAVTRRRPRTALALAAVAGLLCLGGVATAASQSLPGDPFYDLKRGEESVQLALSFSEQAKGEQHLEMATTRLLEVRGLVQGREALRGASPSPADDAGSPVMPERMDRVTGTLVAMDASTRSGTTLLADLYREGDTAVSPRTLELWAESQTSRLNALLPRLDSSGRDQAAQSLALLQDVDDKAAELITSGPTEVRPTDPSVPPAAPSES